MCTRVQVCVYAVADTMCFSSGVKDTHTHNLLGTFYLCARHRVASTSQAPSLLILVQAPGQ